MTPPTRRTLLALLATLLPLAGARAAANRPEEDTAATPSPAPSPSEALLQQPVSQLIGKRLRALKPGMAMTMDYREDRVNIETDETGRIVRIFVG